jgi:hypothetical protein
VKVFWKNVLESLRHRETLMEAPGKERSVTEQLHQTNLME